MEQTHVFMIKILNFRDLDREFTLNQNNLWNDREFVILKSNQFKNGLNNIPCAKLDHSYDAKRKQDDGLSNIVLMKCHINLSVNKY